MSRKKKIVELLRNSSLLSSEVLALLDESISLATLKRDLKSMIESNILIVRGKGKATRYQVSEIFALLDEFDLEKYFELDLYQRKIKKNFNSSVINFLNSNWQFLFTTEEINLLTILIDGYKLRREQIESTILKKEYERLTIELAWKSSQIEGNTYSILETESLIVAGKEATGHSKEEAIMIMNHKKTLDYILAEPKQFSLITSEKIEKIHSLLTEDLEISQGIRSGLIGISGTAYRPHGNQHDLQLYLHDIADLLNQAVFPPTKALITLALIPYLQAFSDGNKRTSRMLANAILIANNFCPLSFGSVDEHEYKRALILFYEQNNISYLKKIFIEQLEFTIGNYFR